MTKLKIKFYIFQGWGVKAPFSKVFGGLEVWGSVCLIGAIYKYSYYGRSIKNIYPFSYFPANETKVAVIFSTSEIFSRIILKPINNPLFSQIIWIFHIFMIDRFSPVCCINMELYFKQQGINWANRNIKYL